jgi:hypothetical protein
MTYFGVNYFLTGLHSYAAGDAGQVPTWVHVGAWTIIALVGVSYVVKSARSWQPAST